jgi:methylglyoxal synthase
MGEAEVWRRAAASRLVGHEESAMSKQPIPIPPKKRIALVLLEQALQAPVIKLQSGPLGGDQQVGAKIAEGSIDFVIFFWDPLEPQPHDPDVKALLRIAVVWNIPVACNRASADFMISSPLMASAYERLLPDYQAYRDRLIPGGDS